MIRPDLQGPLPPGGTIGIIGGGQLGRMSAMAAARLGYHCHIFSPEAGGPAAEVARAVTVGAYDDPEALQAFAAAVDVITFEFENISAAGLDLLSSIKPVRPSPAVLRVSQDRVTEKSFVNGASAPTAPWAPINAPEELARQAAEFGFPCVLKTTRLGYDGRGQAVLLTEADIAPAWERLAPRPLILEGFVDFACEISVIVARGVDGTTVAFDVAENRHRQHILDVAVAPARIAPDLATQATHIACRIARGLNLVGLLAVEMFIDRQGRVLVNELAPRPHNSGHWTIDACPVSQFEMHIRAVAGLPLPPAVRHSDAAMKNLVGPEAVAKWPVILATPGLIPHLYGKLEARPGRKMGHVTHLFPKGALPGEFGVEAALGPLAE
jgi:5-(carboxyamino)imidazole ribonucleotide synthase